VRDDRVFDIRVVLGCMDGWMDVYRIDSRAVDQID